jgi:hypothetical protein
MGPWESEQWLRSYGSRKLWRRTVENPVTANYFANSNNSLSPEAKARTEILPTTRTTLPIIPPKLQSSTKARLEYS